MKYIGAFTGWGAGHCTPLKNMGYKTVPCTVNTRANANTFNGVNVWGMFSEDPWAISGRYVEARRDPFGEQTKWIRTDIGLLSEHDATWAYVDPPSS